MGAQDRVYMRRSADDPCRYEMDQEISTDDGLQPPPTAPITLATQVVGLLVEFSIWLTAAFLAVSLRGVGYAVEVGSRQGLWNHDSPIIAAAGGILVVVVFLASAAIRGWRRSLFSFAVAIPLGIYLATVVFCWFPPAATEWLKFGVVGTTAVVFALSFSYAITLFLYDRCDYLLPGWFCEIAFEIDFAVEE